MAWPGQIAVRNFNRYAGLSVTRIPLRQSKKEHFTLGRKLAVFGIEAASVSRRPKPWDSSGVM